MVKLELEVEKEENVDLKKTQTINIKKQPIEYTDSTFSNDSLENNNYENHYSSYEELIDSIGFNEEESVFSFEKETKLNVFQRFMGYYIFSNAIMLLMFGFWFSLFFIPLLVCLGLMFYSDNDKELLRLYSFASVKVKNKLLLTKKIEAYKNDIYEKVLSVRENQIIILKHLDTYAKENSYKVSSYFLGLIDRLKDAFQIDDQEETLQLLNEINTYMKSW